ncbi:MAG: hypothetical protein AAF549_06975 [Pseudomonadota bacterium]
MSLRESFSIAFSFELADSTSAQKREALYHLLDYIEHSPDIPDISSDGEHILDTIYTLVVELLEENETLKKDRLTITQRPLTDLDQRMLRIVGFDIYKPVESHEGVYVAS